MSEYPDIRQIRQACAYLKVEKVPCLLKGRYNMLNREPETDGIIDDAFESGTGFIAFSPWVQRLLTNRYINGISDDSRIARNGYLKKESLTEKMLKQIKELNNIAVRCGQTLVEMSLLWLLKDNKVTSVIVGASLVEQLSDNIEVIKSISFDVEELRQINDIILGR